MNPLRHSGLFDKANANTTNAIELNFAFGYNAGVGTLDGARRFTSYLVSEGIDPTSVLCLGRDKLGQSVLSRVCGRSSLAVA